MKLVIVESPGKVKKIKAILGPDYQVLASIGHIRDLPRHGLGVDLEDGFAETYSLIEGKKQVVARLMRAAQDAEIIYLASDPDREGEAIAWHIAEILPRRDRKKIRRITFNQVTDPAVKAAVEQAGPIDRQLVNAQRARRVLDRLVGYQVSPLLRDWGLHSDRPLSAGRVQTAALRLIVEQERERRDFVPQKFWQIVALLQKDDLLPFQAKLTAPATITTEDDLAAILDDLETATHWWVDRVEEKTQHKHPPAPFTTSTLQQEASKRLKLTLWGTQRAAQALYELGAITYPRTDATHVAPEAQAAARQVIEANFGSVYLPDEPPSYTSQGRTQEAHEAIRPTDLRLNPETIGADPNQTRLYNLIWQRFIASQMSPATFTIIEVEIKVGNEGASLPHTFHARSRRQVFDGYQVIYQEKAEDDEQPDEEDELTELPPLSHDDRLTRREINAREKHSQPPHRFTQARLIAQLERLGIGRPSTFASTVETVLDRDYARMEKRHLVPTPLGEAVFDVLIQHFPMLFALDFTALMETQLDRIARGEIKREPVLAVFYEMLAPSVAAARQSALNRRATGEACPTCGQPLVIRRGKNGSFIGCSAWPDCTYTRNSEKEKES